jgi:hypothetical protein
MMPQQDSEGPIEDGTDQKPEEEAEIEPVKAVLERSGKVRRHSEIDDAAE